MADTRAGALLQHIRRLIAHCPKSDNTMQDQLFKSFMYEQIVKAIQVYDEGETEEDNNKENIIALRDLLLLVYPMKDKDNERLLVAGTTGGRT